LTDREKVALAEAYKGDLPLKVLCYQFRISQTAIHRLARREGWPRRLSAQGIANIRFGRWGIR
jgi:hypothetical protein